MTEEEFNRTLKELDCVLLDVVYDKFETPLDVAKFVITLNKINERMIIEENEELEERLRIESQSLHEQCEIVGKQVEQIEKMKCCGNCKFCEIDGTFCYAYKQDERYIEKCCKWELAE